MDSKLIERALAVTPVLAHLNEKVQEDVTAQELLDISASGASDLFQSRTCSSNNNCSMRRPFYVDQTMDSRDVFGIFPSLGHDRGDVRQLFTGQLKDLFSYKLCGKSALRLIGHLIFGIQQRRLGQMLEYFLQ